MIFTVSKLANFLSAKFIGDGDYPVYGIKGIDDACANYLSFINSKQYLHLLDNNNAGVLLLTQDLATNYTGNAIIVEDVYLSYAKVSQLFTVKNYNFSIHQTAQIDITAKIGVNAQIGANCVIGANVQIGDNAQIGANCVIGANTKIGKESLIYPNVTLYHSVQIGDKAIIHSGVVIGSDGFGFAQDKQGVWHKIAQLGGVEIGDNVEIGANTAIDRGALQNTKIGNGVKLDNQIMIAHNVEIGDNTVIAGCCGIAGSTKIGKNCMFAGGVCLAGHIEICDNVFITGMTMVSRSITSPGSYSSGIAMQPTNEWRKSVVHIRRLDDTVNKIKELEREVKALKLQFK